VSERNFVIDVEDELPEAIGDPQAIPTILDTSSRTPSSTTRTAATS